jgi:hypothetical protein
MGGSQTQTRHKTGMNRPMKSQDPFPELNQRIPMRGEDEYDWLTGWRHVLVKNHLSRQKIKRKYNRRWRKQVRSWVKAQTEGSE